MYARATVVITTPDRVDAVIDLVRDRVVPVVDEQPGSLGLSMNVDRESGRCTVTSIWTDRGSMHASDPALEPVREQAERVAGAPLATEAYEVAVLHRVRQAEPGCWVRGTRVHLDPQQLDAGIRTFRHHTLPAVAGLPGFRSALLLVDRRSGNGVVSVVFDDRAALDASRAQAGQVREEASAETSAQVVGVVESEIVVAGLRLPLQDGTAPAAVG
jgi:quinol monooxygenase YgiN